jgi:hypothetical protein
MLKNDLHVFLGRQLEHSRTLVQPGEVLDDVVLLMPLNARLVQILKMGTPWVGVRVSARRRTGLR